MPANQETITDYRHDATRKNIPPATLAAQGRVREAPGSATTTTRTYLPR